MVPMQTPTEPSQSIAEIDRRIDAVRAELIARKLFNQRAVGAWHKAWKRNPDLMERERRLFLQRSQAYIESTLSPAS